MNILYILGNGFDKAQGMHTSYPEFYKYLMDKKGSVFLEQLKKDIDAKTELWSDMEVALGKFTSQISTASNFDDLYYELSDHLQNYLKKEESNYKPSNEQKEKFVKDFISPFNYIEESDSINYVRLLNEKKPIIGHPDTHSINVITFNYTNTLERLFPNDIVEKSNNFRESYAFDYSHYLKNIIHLHGQLGDSIIIGVDNEEQIANEQFRKNADIKDLLVKEQSNQVMGNTRHEQCEGLVREADVIILYGVSLGETDASWWSLIRNMFEEEKLYIVQHLYKENYSEVPSTKKQLYGRIKRENRLNLMKKLGFSENQEDWPHNTNERLFFITNSNLFKL